MMSKKAYDFEALFVAYGHNTEAWPQSVLKEAQAKEGFAEALAQEKALADNLQAHVAIAENDRFAASIIQASRHVTPQVPLWVQLYQNLREVRQMFVIPQPALALSLVMVVGVIVSLQTTVELSTAETTELESQNILYDTEGYFS